MRVTVVYILCRIYRVKRVVVVSRLFTGLAVMERELCRHQLGASSRHSISTPADLPVSAAAATLRRRVSTAQRVQVPLVVFLRLTRPLSCLKSLSSISGHKVYHRGRHGKICLLVK